MKGLLFMKNTIIKIFCLSLAALSLTACSKTVPSSVIKDVTTNVEFTTDTISDIEVNQSVINEKITTNVESNTVTMSESEVTQAATNQKITANSAFPTVTTIATEITQPATDEKIAANVESTTADTTEAEIIPEITPENFYTHFKPLNINVFDGNEIYCKPEIYAEQVKLIDNQIDYIYGEDYNPSLEAKLLISALLSNQNIESKYKKWLFHMIEYFDDNVYIQREEIYDKLMALQIETQIFDVDDENALYGAEYIPDESKIIFYIIEVEDYVNDYMCSAEYEESGLSYVDYDVYNMIKHEIFHNTVSAKINNLCGFLDEGITVLLVEEYNNGNIGYTEDHRILYIKMLIELIGKDKVMEAYSKADWSIIEDALLEIDPDICKPQRIYDLMVEWDEAWINSQCNFFIVNTLTEDIRAEMSQILTEYYNKAYPYADENSVYSIYEKMFMGIIDDSFYDITEVYFNSRYEEDWFIKKLY